MGVTRAGCLHRDRVCLLGCCAGCCTRACTAALPDLPVQSFIQSICVLAKLQMAPKRIRTKRAPEDISELEPATKKRDDTKFHGNPKANSWVFVLTGAHVHRLPLHFDSSTMETLAYQKEVGPRSGLEHVQGYVQLRVAKRATLVASAMGCPFNSKGQTADGQVSFRPAHGTCAQNVAYCTAKEYCKECHGGVDGHPGSCVCTCGSAVLKGREEGSTVFHGVICEADTLGPREMVQRAIAGASLRQLYLTNPVSMFRYGRQYAAAAAVLTPQRSKIPLVLWFSGRSGSGKSSFISEICDRSLIFLAWSNQWFDGYDGADHKVFVLDDARGKDFQPNWLLRLLDRFPLKLAVKGSSTEMRAPVIIITSCQDPERFWAESCETAGRVEPFAQLDRRINESFVFPLTGAEQDRVKTRVRARLAGDYQNLEPAVIRGWLPEDGMPRYPMFGTGGSSSSGGTTLQMGPPDYEEDRQRSGGSDSPVFLPIASRFDL